MTCFCGAVHLSPPVVYVCIGNIRHATEACWDEYNSNVVSRTR